MSQGTSVPAPPPVAERKRLGPPGGHAAKGLMSREAAQAADYAQMQANASVTPLHPCCPPPPAALPPCRLPGSCAHSAVPHKPRGMTAARLPPPLLAAENIPVLLPTLHCASACLRHWPGSCPVRRAMTDEARGEQRPVTAPADYHTGGGGAQVAMGGTSLLGSLRLAVACALQQACHDSCARYP
jgi:hypothetical protein